MLKRRNLTNQSPGSGKNTSGTTNVRSVVRPAQDSGSEADRGGKSKRKRKKSSRKNLSMASPSSDDTGQGEKHQNLTLNSQFIYNNSFQKNPKFLI